MAESSTPRSASLAGAATVAPASRPGAAVTAGAADFIQELWLRVRADVLATAGEHAKRLEPWLARLRPVALRESTFELQTRSPKALPLLRARIAPLLTESLRRVVGAPLRLRIELDQSLGGALRALGVRPQPLPPEPPPFVARPESRLAIAALLRMARDPQPEFDQLVVEGPAGVGKSLLLSTMIWQRRRRHPTERWRRDHGEPLFRDFAAACREGSRASFRGERIACDGYVLDDVHELSGKLGCQEQLVEMLEYLRARRRPIVIAGRPLEGGPRDWLPTLRSFLRQGLRLAIPQLAAASRAEILHARAGSARGTIGALVDELAAATELPMSRAVTAVEIAQLRAKTLGRPPTREELEAALGDLLPTSRDPEPFDRVLDRCAQFAAVSRDALVAGSRARGAALARHLAVYLAYEVFRLQRATVRRWLGPLSPSVQPYAKAKIDALRVTDRRLDGFIREVAEEIGRGQRFLFV